VAERTRRDLELSGCPACWRLKIGLLILKGFSGSFLEFRDFFPSGCRVGRITSKVGFVLGSFGFVLGSFLHRFIDSKREVGFVLPEKKGGRGVPKPTGNSQEAAAGESGEKHVARKCTKLRPFAGISWAGNRQPPLNNRLLILKGISGSFRISATFLRSSAQDGFPPARE